MLEGVAGNICQALPRPLLMLAAVAAATTSTTTRKASRELSAAARSAAWCAAPCAQYRRIGTELMERARHVIHRILNPCFIELDCILCRGEHYPSIQLIV